MENYRVRGAEKNQEEREQDWTCGEKVEIWGPAKPQGFGYEGEHRENENT